MRWFLKCFYGYRNLWDEFLFWWVLEYIDTMYNVVDELTVEVADVEWMQSRWTRNSDIMNDLGLASWFVSQRKIIKFVEVSKDIRDNFIYDIYFFGGGEVFAESRGFHGWWNYMIRYLRALHTRPFVLLWGIETPRNWRQKILYKYLLPKADKIVCREEYSYKVAHHYTTKIYLYSDFAIPLLDRYRQHSADHHTQTLTSHDPYHIHDILRPFGKQYVLINMIWSMSTDHSYRQIEKFVSLYPHHTLVYVACGTDDQWREDRYYAKRLQGVYPEMAIYDREEYSLVQTLSLFQYAKAGMWCRLHFLLMLQELHVPRYALVYAEKIKKLITSNITL